MKTWFAATTFLLLTVTTALSRAQTQKETDWRPPLAEGGAPECSDHLGSRTLRSETVSDGSATAVIVGTTVRLPNNTCQNKADLIITDHGHRTTTLPDANDHSFSIADFSPDGQNLLLVAEVSDISSDSDLRNVLIAVVGIAHSDIRFINTWDLFHWGHCYATVEPQGFTDDGRILLLARPSVFSAHRDDPNCVSDWGLYATDLTGRPVRLPENTKVPRFGKVVTDQVQACKSDPDIIGACFTVHGRLSAWNGTPSLRIWRVGTNRTLGDHEDWPLPEDLAEGMDWNVEAWGDFEVCPFAKERPGVMQMVCIQSANHVTFKQR